MSVLNSLVILLASAASAIPFSTSTSTFASSVDLRDRLTPVVQNQGARNTCSAFAATALMEFLIKNESGRDVDLSEQYNYWASKILVSDSNYTQQIYAGVDGLAGYLAVQGLQHGVVEENQWKYSAQNWQQSKDPRCLQSGSAWATECFTAQAPESITQLPYKVEPLFIEREEIASFLQIYQTPVVMNIQWYLGLVNRAGDFTRSPTPQERALCTRQNQGCSGHVVLLVGYDSERKLFRFRNSWGPKWGSGGYGTIPEAMVLDDCEVCHNLPNLGRYPDEVREFVIKVSRGVSARITF